MGFEDLGDLGVQRFGNWGFEGFWGEMDGWIHTSWCMVAMSFWTDSASGVVLGASISLLPILEERRGGVCHSCFWGFISVLFFRLSFLRGWGVFGFGGGLER